MTEDNELRASGGWCAPSEVIYDASLLRADMVPISPMFPDLQIRRGGLEYREPTDEEKIAQANHDRRHAAWKNSMPGVEVSSIWLAYRDDGYDGEHLLGVATSEELARLICQHAADEPNRWRDRGDTTIDWEDNYGMGGNRWYGVRQIGVRE